ncbi:hypothetical protein [Pararhizobium antarcticum]|uniref:AB hydrolase-1 domain-containing protein n=1 Tax=Pararhizobium antarcticum TaxID=1798805 RepID=A0A657LSM7_9HYPH|nr:hypothetical protein [Pararhizobium antarcticum]OJF92878.1 hypothetical protein AX760_21860 [Pararhizobium antarcticum]OJF97721.1 hypothetical protein AX761_14095 [Rhizobium sp. 58]
MTLGLLLLHALPLDGSMWAAQRNLLPGATSAPTLYGFGSSVEDWAAKALETTNAERLIVVGCSVGGPARSRLPWPRLIGSQPWC